MCLFEIKVLNHTIFDNVFKISFYRNMVKNFKGPRPSNCDVRINHVFQKLTFFSLSRELWPNSQKMNEEATSGRKCGSTPLTKNNNLCRAKKTGVTIIIKKFLKQHKIFDEQMFIDYRHHSSRDLLLHVLHKI